MQKSILCEIVILLVSRTYLIKKLWDQLHETKKEVEQANRRVEEAETTINKMEDHMQLAKTKLGAVRDAKDKTIHALDQQLEEIWGEEGRGRKGQRVRDVYSYAGGVLC